MYEAIVTLCIGLAGDVCRDQLLPGYEADSVATCRALLDADPPIITVGRLHVQGDVRCAPAGEALTVEEVAPGLFVHEGQIAEPDTANRGDVANLGFIVGTQGVAVIDTGSARWIGEALWRAIRVRTELPVSHVVLTHMHPDHVMGAGPFVAAGAQVVGHDGLPRALADRQGNYLESLTRLLGARAMIGTAPASTDLTVKDSVTLDLGGRMLDIRAWPAAHTGTDVTVFDRATGTLFAGDLVFHRHTPALDGRLAGWRNVLEELVAMDLARLVPGHGDAALDWPAGGADVARYLAVLAADTRRAIDQGARLSEAVEQIAQGEAPQWELFDAYNPRNATVAFTELEWE